MSLSAIAMSVSVAAMTGPAEADFLYVPPREAASAESWTDRLPAAHAAATERNDLAGLRAHGDPEAAATRTERADADSKSTPLRVAAPRYADAEPLEKSDAPRLWQVRAGEMLREALGRWGEDAGVEVLFLTDRRYRLHEGRRFHGSFGEASQALLAALSHMPHPPVGEAKHDNRTLVVMHRASPHGASQHRPGRTGDGR